LTKNFLGGVLWKIQLEEACVSLRKSPVWFVAKEFHDFYLLDAVRPSESSETLNWHFAGTCDKLDEFSFLAIVEFCQDFPKPLNDH
jgi:hypothetical protein